MQKHCIGAILHCFCFLLLASSSNAQSYKLRLGAEVKDKIRPDRFIREDADGNIYVSGVSLKYKMLLPLGLINYYDADIRKFVKKYGSNLELVQEKPVLTPGSTVKSSPFKGKLNVTGALGYNTITIQNASLETVELWDRTIVILATNKKNAIEITAEEIDLETGVSFNSHKIANIKVPTGTKRRIDSIVVKKSPDGSRALIFCSGASRANGKKSLTFSATVINSDFSVLWQKQFNLPEAKKGLSYRSADLSNDGTLYILAKTAPNRRTKPTLSIISLNSETQAPVTRVINFGSLVVSDAYLTVDGRDKPTLIGFYKDKPKQHSFEGIVYAEVAEDGTISNTSKKEFTASLVGSTFSDKGKRKLDRAISKGKDIDESDDYLITDFVKTPDGGQLFVAESYDCNLVVRTSTSGTGANSVSRTSQYYAHYFGDLIVIKIGSDGKLNFVKKIAKDGFYRSAFENKIYEKDYNLQMVGDKYYFIFNDEKNETANRHKKNNLFSGAGSQGTFIVSMDNSGNIKKDLVMTKEHRGRYTLTPSRDMLLLSNNKIAFVMVKGMGLSRKTRIGTITVL